jgi:rhodanese-related sulfurtransferase
MLSAAPAANRPRFGDRPIALPARSEKIARAPAPATLPHLMADEAIEHTLAPARANELEDAQFIDVRTSDEYEAGRIPGARFVRLDEVQAAADSFDRERPIVFYCRSGDRSTLAVDAFRASGWDAYAIEGGLAAWADEGLPLEPEGGQLAHHSGLPPA